MTLKALLLQRQFCRFFARIDRHADGSHLITSGGPFATQLFEPLDTALVARASGFNALTDPDLFLCPEFIEASTFQFFSGKLLFFSSLIGCEIPGIGSQYSAVELNDTSGYFVKERTVMGDDDE